MWLPALWGRRLRVGLVALLAGCQAVPARIPSCRSCSVPRPVLAVGQILDDMAHEVVRHPLQIAGSVVLGPVVMSARLLTISSTSASP